MRELSGLDGGSLAGAVRLGLARQGGFARALVLFAVEEVVVPGWETLVKFVEEAAVVAEGLCIVLVISNFTIVIQQGHS